MAKQSLLQKFGRLSEAKKLLVFLLAFVVIGGGYMAYKSFAAEISSDSTSTAKTEPDYVSQADISAFSDTTISPDVSDGSCKRLGTTRLTLVWFNDPKLPQMNDWKPAPKEATYYPRIKLGDNNECVRLFKKMLNVVIENGYSGNAPEQNNPLHKMAENTKFDEELQKQVKIIQRWQSNGVRLELKEIKSPPTGIVDPPTWGWISYLNRYWRVH